jgi:hypothetical protein
MNGHQSGVRGFSASILSVAGLSSAIPGAEQNDSDSSIMPCIAGRFVQDPLVPACTRAGEAARINKIFHLSPIWRLPIADYLSSLIPQRLNRAQPRCLPSRGKAGQHSSQHGNNQCDYDQFRREHNRKRGKCFRYNHKKRDGQRQSY